MNLHEQYHTDKLAMTHPTPDSHEALGILCLAATSPGYSHILVCAIQGWITDAQSPAPAPYTLQILQEFWRNHGQAIAVSDDGKSLSTTRMQYGGQWKAEPGYRLVPANDVGIAIFGPELFGLISAE